MREIARGAHDRWHRQLRRGPTRTTAAARARGVLTTRAAGVDNLAAMTQFVPCSAPSSRTWCVASARAAACLTRAYPTFHRQLAEMTRDTVDATLIDGTLALVPGLREQLERGIDVADIGCGSGYAMNVLARAFPNSRFTGFDFSEEAIAAAAAQAEEWGLDNVALRGPRRRPISARPTRSTRSPRSTRSTTRPLPTACCAASREALRPDGVYLCVDVAASSHVEDNIDHPLGPAIYTISTMHCMTVSLALDGAGLGAAWGEQTALAMLADAGFTSVTTEQVEGDVVQRLLHRPHVVASRRGLRGARRGGRARDRRGRRRVRLCLARSHRADLPGVDPARAAAHVGEFTALWTHVLCEGMGRAKPPYAELGDGQAAGEWYADLAGHLVDELHAASADTPAWMWLPGEQTARPVARRCANELAVHRFDAQTASRSQSAIDAAHAVDIIDEVFVLVPAWGNPPDGSGKVLHVCGTDRGEWTITMTPGGLEVARRAQRCSRPDAARRSL